MIKRNLHAIIVMLGLILVMIIIAGIISVTLFYQTVTEFGLLIENGSIVRIHESGSHSIFIEDYVPPTLTDYDFIFSNIESNDITFSVIADSDMTYSVGAVTINDEIAMGRFGRLIAHVDLEEGSYLVEYREWDGTGTFVIEKDRLNTMFWFIIQVLFLSLAFIVFTVMLIVSTVKYKHYKKQQLETISANS